MLHTFNEGLDMTDKVERAIAAHMRATNRFTLQYMQDVKRALGIDSDYALAKALGVSKTTVSHYRNGENAFSPRVCHTVARLLGINPAVVVSAIEVDRHSGADQKEIDTWAWIHKAVSAASKNPATAKLAVLFALVFVAQFLGGQDASAGLTLLAGSLDSVYIV